MGRPFNIYSTEHQHSRVVCTAVSIGTGFPMVPVSPLQPGGVCMYGFLRGLLPTLNAAREQGRAWVYVDRGYFRAMREGYEGYFRLTRNALQHDGRGEYDRRRWDMLAMNIAPWKRQGKHVLVCPPGDTWLAAFGKDWCRDQKSWLKHVLGQLELHTDRPLRVRYKPKNLNQPEVPFEQDLQDCWAVVTHMSNTAVEAVLAGVPTFTTSPCAAALMGERDLAKIEEPAYPEREQWAYALASNQWTLAEIRAGAANHLFE